ncbi:MAG TPA: alpha-2-macroglobulin family protein, partial [Anaeromyxobacteraceae bacterium]|nr:alpha-2-macroglobulin family protein [Anaeromyxobacteraceae bacterium]
MTVTEPVEEAVGSCRVRPGLEPAPCTFQPKAPGLHVAEAVVRDERGRRQATRAAFYVVGDGWVSWNRDDTDRIEMVADKEVYAVGDTARVLVKSPFPGAEGLLPVEREGVMEKRRVRIGQAAATFDIPITEASVPNVFASLVLVRGRQGGVAPTAKDDPGRPSVRIGYVQLKVERKGKRLAVDLKVDAQEKRPREKVTVDVQVRDAAGKGVQAEVALWAVDEGVLRLTGYAVPDLLEILHPLRGLSVRVAESLVHLVMRKAYGEKGVSAGGSGGLDAGGSTMRTQFRTTAVFLPEVLTDADGRARVEFELPDNLTTFRIMAIAVTRGDRVGSGQASVTVSRPLLALPALPRLARVGDAFEAGVVVHAPGGKVGKVEVAATATGLALEGEARKQVDLAAGKAREVRFRFRAETAGQAVLRFTVQGAGVTDGVEERIPVVLPVSREAVAVHGETRDVGRQAIVLPTGVRSDVGGLETSLSSSALAGLQEGMRQLVAYPYGCLEQLSSRLVPFTALREIQGRYGGNMTPAKGDEADAWMAEWVGEDALRAAGARDPDEVIRRTVRSIEALQTPDGGYRYWPGQGCSSELGSSWAVVALSQAARAGYPVDAAALKRGQEYLAVTVAAGKCTSCGWGCTPPPASTRAFAVWALARSGSPRASFHRALWEERASMPLFAQALLADAMYLAGNDRAGARALLEEVLGQAKVSGGEVHFEEPTGPAGAARWSSDVRTTAIVLQTLVDVLPDHPFVPRMASWLVAARGKDGRYRNTQEAAFALSAMAGLSRVKEREAPDFTARAVLGGRTLAEAPFHGRTLAVAKGEVPMKELGAAGVQVPLEFRRDGRAGTLYYGALLRYAPEKPPVDALDRGIHVQRWFEPWEGGGQARAARAGDLVRVKVRVATPRARSDVAVEVPIP